MKVDQCPSSSAPTVRPGSTSRKEHRRPLARSAFTVSPSSQGRTRSSPRRSRFTKPLPPPRGHRRCLLPVVIHGPPLMTLLPPPGAHRRRLPPVAIRGRPLMSLLPLPGVCRRPLLPVVFHGHLHRSPLLP